MPALTDPAECFMGPMDGAEVEAGALKHGVLKCGIVRRKGVHYATSGHNATVRELVWGWAGPHDVSCATVIYRMKKGRLIYEEMLPA